MALVAATLILLGALVWGLVPSRPKLTPAPLNPPLTECPKVLHDFIPTNLTELPASPDGTSTGSELAALPASARNRALYLLNMRACTCGCNLSVAACRVNDPACKTSAELAKQLIREAREMKDVAGDNH